MDFVTGLDQGVNTYLPALSSNALAFTRLDNLEPRRARLLLTKQLEDFQPSFLDDSGSDYVLGFGYYQFSGQQFANFYAVTTKYIYWFDFEVGAFDPVPIYTYAEVSTIPPIFLPWIDCLYIVRYDQPPVKIEYKTVTEQSGEFPRARYGIVFNSHFFLANVGTSAGKYFTRIQWSDLEAPESWEINPLVSEADFFDLEAGNSEITGLTLQRGNGLIYTSNSIWLATAVGFPGGFRLEPLFTGVGNILHHAVVHNKDVDYFIGPDNFYVLNGFQLAGIGDAIWNEFIADCKIAVDATAHGYLDTRANQVFWIYTKQDDTLGCVVYNYLEQKWSFRDARGISAFYDSPRLQLRGYRVIDDYDELPEDIIDNNTDLYPDDPSLYTPYLFPQLFGSFDSLTALRLSDLSVEEATLETYDLHFDNIEQTKELNKVTIDWNGTGAPEFALAVGTRKTQNSTITWSTPVNTANVDGSHSFYFRSTGVGKYVRFRLTITNVDLENQADELLLWSYTLVSKTSDDSSR